MSAPSRRSSLILLILFLVPCAVVPALADRWILPQRTLFVAGTLLAAIVSVLRARSPIPPLPRLTAIGLAATTAALLFAAARAPDPSAALDALALDLCAMGFALLVLTAIDERGGSRAAAARDRDPRESIATINGLAPGAIASAIVAAALVQSLLGPIQIAGGAPSVDPEGKLAFTGTLGNPEYVAALCGIALCLVPALPASRSRVPIAVVLALTLLLTRSRGACLAAAAAAALVWLPRRRAAALAAIAAAGAMLFLVTGTRSANGRVLVWLFAGREAIASHGLGTGLGGFGSAMVDAQRWVLEHGGGRFADGAAMVSRAHDEPLDALAEGGLALLAAAALLAAVPLACAWRHRDAWSAALFFVALFSLVSFPLHEPAALAATAAVTAVLLSRAPARAGMRQPLRVPAAAALGLLLALHAASSSNAIAASRLEADATASLRRGRFLEADARARAALAFRPRDPSLLLLRGRLLYHAFRPAEALAYARERDRLAGPSVDGLKLEGMALLDLGRTDDALATYRRLESAFPRQVTAHAQIGRILLAKGDREGAARELALAVACPAANHKAVVDRLRAGDRLRSLRDSRPDLLQ